jgi:fucose permease
MERRIGGSSTMVVESLELDTVGKKHNNEVPLISTGKRTSSFSGRSLGSTRSNAVQGHTFEQDPDRNETLPSPTTATEQFEKWHTPRINIYRVLATFWSFIVAGLNDASYGPLIPYLEEYYGLSYLVVSLVFLSPFV